MTTQLGKRHSNRSAARLAAAVLAGLAVQIAVTTPARSECPMSNIGEGCQDWLGVVSYLPAAQWDPSGEGVPWAAGDPCPVGCYDIPAGVLEARGYAHPWGECGSAPWIHDEFMVIGLPPAVPLSFQAELHVEGAIAGGGRISGSIAYQGATWRTQSVSTKVVHPLEHSPFEPFPLDARLEASGEGVEGTVVASARLYFTGLPPGAIVISCQSYSLPVQTMASSWGRVKAVYR